MGVMALLMVSASSTFVPGLPEVTLVYYVQGLHWDATEVALLFAAGQCAVYLVFYVAGDTLMRRWAWLNRNVMAVRTRYHRHLESRFLSVAAFSGVSSVPPVVVMSSLGSGFGVPLRHLLPVLYGGRVVRFLVLIFFGAQLTAFFHAHVMPP